MSSEEWKKVQLGDACTITTGFPFKGDQYSSTGVRVLRGENVSVGNLRWDTIKCWNLDFNESYKYSLQEGDIVIGMDGAKVGKNRAQIRKEDLPLLLAQRVARVRANGSFSQDYLFYVIRGDNFENYIDSIKTGTSIPHISAQQLKEFEFYALNIETQNRFAQILRSIDDKIELNRQTNATLEAIAQAIFKEWFVDFNYPGATGELIDSELGPIPKGWRVGKVNEVIKRIPSGKKFDFKSALREGKVPIIDQAHFRTIGFHNEEPGVIATPDQPVIVFSNHRCYTSIFLSSFSTIQNVLPFLGRNVDTYWLYHATDGIITYSEYKGHWPDFISISIIIPPCELTKEYGELVKDGHSIIVENNAENQTLIAIRDSLLPRLMKKEVEF